MKIGIVGHGVVGSAMARFLSKQPQHDVFIYDKFQKQHDCADWITPPFCIRSTVIPGTVDRLAAQTGKAITFSPEYLGEHRDHPWHEEGACGFGVHVETVNSKKETVNRIGLERRLASIL